MAQDIRKKLAATFSLLNWKYRFGLLALMFAGVLLVFGVSFWRHQSGEKLLILQIGQTMAAAGAHPTDDSVAQPTKSLADLVKELITEPNQQYGWLGDAVRDLGIALILSVIVTVVIEKNASDRLREHIAHDVLTAAYAKVIPEEIYTQVADNVFRSNVYRRKWEVKINAKLADKVKGIAIINVFYFYELENLNGHAITYPIPGVIDLDVPLEDQDIPKFKWIEIFDKHNPELVLEKDTRALLAKQKEATHREGNLTFTRNKQEMRFAAQVPISPEGKVTVKYEVERAIRVPGDYVLHAPVRTASRSYLMLTDSNWTCFLCIPIVTRCVSSNLTLGCSTPAYCHGRDSGSRPGLKVRASCLQEHQTPGEQYETTFN
jgi:hypothetical protein